jgi:hypothetical protein
MMDYWPQIRIITMGAVVKSNTRIPVHRECGPFPGATNQFILQSSRVYLLCRYMTGTGLYFQ